MTKPFEHFEEYLFVFIIVLESMLLQGFPKLGKALNKVAKFHFCDLGEDVVLCAINVTRTSAVEDHAYLAEEVRSS